MEMAEAEYVTTIADLFVSLRKGPLMLSPLDTELIHSWCERGVPLFIVTGAIRDMLGARSDGPARIRSLSYCQEEIEARYTEWLGARVGSA